MKFIKKLINNKVKFLIGLFILSSIGFCNDSEIDYQSLVEENVVKIISDTTYCTGFLIDDNLILTVAHLGVGTFDIQFKDGKKLKAKTYKINSKNDIQLLKTTTFHKRKYEFKFAESIKNGDDIFYIGCLDNLGFSYFEGYVSNVSVKTKLLGKTKYDSILVDIPAAGGSSGSAVFNSNGEIIGIVSANLDATDTLGVLTNVKYIKRLLDKTKEETK